MEQQSIFSQEDFHASLSLVPGNKEAKKMTVISGRKCYELYQKYAQLGLLVKMLLESSIWDSTKCFLTWKTRATPANRLLFQLVPSTPRTEEIGSGLLPTAQNRDYRSPDLQKSRNFKRKQKKGWTIDLNSKIAMLPTPTDSMKTMQDMIQAKFHSSKRPKYADCKILPTPKGSAAGPDYAKLNRSKTGASLQTVVGLLPTPAARDYKGANGSEHMKKKRPHIDQLPNAIAHGTNRGLKLHSDFVTFLMGYPIDWLDIP